MPEFAKDKPAYGSPVASLKPVRPFQPLPKTPAGDLVVALNDIAPKVAERLEKTGRLDFHAVGDTGGVDGTEAEERIARAMQQQIRDSKEDARPGFFYLLGDVVYPVGAPEGYRDLFYKPFKHYDAPIVAIPGNHDGYGRPNIPGSSLDGWKMNFLGTLPLEHQFPYRKPQALPHPYWELATGVATIIGLYSNTEGFLDDPAKVETPQQDWLVARLKAAAPDLPVLIMVHHPPFSFDDDHHGSPAILESLDIAAEKSGRWPDAVFSGHVHSYQRFTRTVGGREIPYVVAGAGGRANQRKRLAKLIEWEGHLPITMPFEALDGQGREIGVSLVAADWSEPGFLTISIDREKLRCTYWQVPFDEGQPVTWQDRFELDFASHRVRTEE